MKKKAMTPKTRTLSRDEYLQALGMFTLAADLDRRCQEIQKALCKHLGVDDDGHVSDSIWGHRTFDEALELSGLKIPEITRKVRKLK